MTKAAYVGVGNTARKVKKIYVGVNGVAKKVKKGYVGVNGVARLFFSEQAGLIYYDTLSLGSTCDMGGTTFNNHGVYAGGWNNNSKYKEIYSTVYAYDSSLTKTQVSNSVYKRGPQGESSSDYCFFAGGSSNSTTKSVTALNVSWTATSPTDLTSYNYAASSKVNDYVLFGGGSLNSTSQLNYVDAYDSSLTKTQAAALNGARMGLAGVDFNNFALFGGGWRGSGRDSLDVYNNSLTHTNPNTLSVARGLLGATTVGDFVLFAGGEINDSNNTGYKTVDVFNVSFTRSLIEDLSLYREYMGSETLAGVAIFVGGYAGTTSTYLGESQNITLAEGYDSSLVKITVPDLSEGDSNLIGTITGNYALFSGGTKGTDRKTFVYTFE